LLATGLHTPLFAQIVGSVDTLQMPLCKDLQPRAVYVWKASNYKANQPHNVLYMHDGQMLFDGLGTWNKKEWRVDETLDSLLRRNLIKPCIVVGICNVNVYRYGDYFPQDVFEKLPKDVQDSLKAFQNTKACVSNDYLKCIVEQLKPQIEKHYKTSGNNAIGGASMGGLISWYAAVKYPDVFKSALCMSTHWPGGNPMKVDTIVFTGFKQYLQQNLKPLAFIDSSSELKGQRFYFDCGTATLDAYYPPLQKQIDKVFYNANYDLMHYWSVYDEGAEHDEVAWAKRFALAMMYLWPKFE
jgi:hypothetical protein